MESVLTMRRIMKMICMEQDDKWKQEAIERDMMAISKKFGRKNTTIVRFYEIESLGKDKLLKIEMRADIYNELYELGINFDDFSKGKKLFETDRDRFMDDISKLGAKAEIVDKDSVHGLLFDNE